MTENGFTIIDSRADGSEKKFPHWDGNLVLHPKPGSMVATQTRAGGATIVFEVNIAPLGASGAIHFEGYTTGRGPGWAGKEYDFVPSALAIAGLPRKRGLELLSAFESAITRTDAERPSTILPLPPDSGPRLPTGSPTSFDLEQIANQQKLFVYILLAGGIALLAEVLALSVTSHSLNVVVDAGGGGGAALCIGGAYWMHRGIRDRIESIRVGKIHESDDTIPASPQPAVDPGYCPACGASNFSTTIRCAACHAPLTARQSFLLEPSRTEADIRRFQVVSGGMAVFLLSLLAWFLSPLTRPGRDFEAAIRGTISFANAPTGTLMLILLGPLASWILWQALNIRRTSESGKLIIEETGVTVFDDSRHRFHLPWADPEFSMVFQDSHGNPIFTRQSIFMRVPRKGNGSTFLSRGALDALELAAHAHALAVSTRPEQMIGAGPVQVISISPSVLPVFAGAFPRPS
jgi:hypothetical protein